MTIIARYKSFRVEDTDHRLYGDFATFTEAEEQVVKIIAADPKVEYLIRYIGPELNPRPNTNRSLKDA